jgi:hypothetical protein
MTSPYYGGTHVTPTSMPALPTPPAVRPTRRQTLVRRAMLLLRLSAWGVAAVLSLIAVGLFLYTRRGDVQAARRAAAEELRLAVDPDERVLHSAHVLQRRWQDYYRETHGVLAATDRRVLFVGVAPREIVSPDQGPQLFEEQSFPYERPLVSERGRVFLGTARGIVLRTEGDKVTFAVAADDRAEMDSVLATVRRVQAELRAAAERDRRAQTFVSWAARLPVYHRVQRGEALISIAQQFGTTPEAIKAWNGLTRDVVKVGQRLLVKPGA